MDKMKKVISAIVLLTLVTVSLNKVSSILQLKESDNRYAAYFAEDARIDVLFLGSSHVRYTFFPMELWNDYGISSFNLAGNGNTIPVCYWTLVNALDYQMPKVVVMDVFDMWPGRIFGEVWGQVHETFDAFPLSINKYRMVKDLFDDKELKDGKGNYIYDKRWELLWDLGEYHTRWVSLEKEDFYGQAKLEEGSAVWKGAYPLAGVAKRNEYVYLNKGEEIYYDEISADYLMRMILLCKERDITLLLINTGYDCSDEAKYFADSVYDISEEYNIPYIDFTKENLINFESDLYDTSDNNIHVNFSGAEKLTSYIGAYLSEHFQLQDHREDDNYVRWWDDYHRFTESKKEHLRLQGSIINYLIFLADEDYQTIFEINHSDILHEDGNAAMFQNIGIDVERAFHNCNLIVLDNESGNAEYFYFDDSEISTGIGEISCIDKGAFSLYLDKKELYEIENKDEGKIRITVLDKNTGEVVDMHIFQ